LNKTEDNEDAWNTAIEAIEEKFLDDVFDVNSKIDRKDFIKLVANKQNFLFRTTELRK
jgi:hypothetical protein